MSIVRRGPGFSGLTRFSAPDTARGSQQDRDTVKALSHAAQTIETAAFNLAHHHPADLIGRLIVLSAELENVISTLAVPARDPSSREN